MKKFIVAFLVVVILIKFSPLVLASESEVQVIKLKPYNVNTEILKEEFSVFRVQYAVLWSILFAAMFIMIEAR